MIGKKDNDEGGKEKGEEREGRKEGEPEIFQTQEEREISPYPPGFQRARI